MKNNFLYHGSSKKIKGTYLEPRQATDLGENPENTKNAVYATNKKEIAIAMAIVTGNGITQSSCDLSKFSQGIIYEGKLVQKYVYLYTLSSAEFSKSVGSGTQYFSLKKVKPIKVEKLKVSDYSNLFHYANKKEKDKWNKKFWDKIGKRDNKIFQQRKESILSKLDKSSIGGWDKKIVTLCNLINKKENYYTTSSCSGRVVIMIDKAQKGPGLFLYVSHDLIFLDKLNVSLNKISHNGLVKFKQEPMILHVACNEINDAKILLEKSRDAGFKKIGIITLGKNIIVEINGSEKLEFPIIEDGEVLVNETFLKLIVKKLNDNLKRNWKQIKKLKEVI